MLVAEFLRRTLTSMPNLVPDCTPPPEQRNILLTSCPDLNFLFPHTVHYHRRPEGLGSNRGFHTALDAVWAVRVLQTDGLEAAILERSFFYDLVVQVTCLTHACYVRPATDTEMHPSHYIRLPISLVQGPWQPQLLKPANDWTADPVTRYADEAIVRMQALYTNPTSKRLFRGVEAIPPRIRALHLASERSS